MTIKHLIITTVLAVSCTVSGHAQKFFTRDAKVAFDATASGSPEAIKGVSKSGTCVFDQGSGAVEMAVLIKGFIFEKALMEEHFNENYLESTKYPKATFKGKLDNPASLNTGKDGTYKMNAAGTLTMHGVSKSVSAPVTFTVKSGKLSVASNFSVTLADYDITVPGLVADKLAKTANISITSDFAPMK